MSMSIAFYLGIYSTLQVLSGVVLHILIQNHNFEKSLDPQYMQAMVQRYVPYIMIASIALSLLIYILVFKIRKQNFMKYINFLPIDKSSAKSIIWIAMAYKILTSTFMIAIEKVNASSLKSSHVTQVLHEHSDRIQLLLGDNLVLALVVIGFIAPIFEEILFRGIVFKKILLYHKAWIALTLQALLFALFHMNLVQGVYTFFLSLLAGIAYYLTKSILAAILLHVVFNASNFVLSPVIWICSINLWTMSITILSMSVFIFFRIHKLFKESNTQHPPISI